MSRLIDITRPLHNGTPEWPGDTPVAFNFVAREAARRGLVRLGAT